MRFGSENTGVVEAVRVRVKPIDLAADTARLTVRTRQRSSREAACPYVLAIGLPTQVQFEGLAITRAKSVREVMEVLRVLDFNLLLVRAEPKDTAVWTMLGMVHRLWPRLQWALVNENCTDELEVLARSLGAVAVTTDPKLIGELAM